MSNNTPDYEDNLYFDCKNCKMTDEYCASGDCPNDTLTEQWRKGELSEGDYYVKDGGNMIEEYIDGYFYNNGEPMTSFSGGVDSVLAPVPSYDEIVKMEEEKRWYSENLHAATDKIKELKEQIKHLQKTQARQFVDNQKLQTKAEKAKDVVNLDTARQIKQLKELLKECKPYFDALVEKRLKLEYIPQVYELLTKIDEVLK